MGIVGVVTEVKKVHPKDLTIINITRRRLNNGLNLEI